MLDRNSHLQVEQMKQQVQTMVALDILRLPDDGRKDMDELRAVAIETLKRLLGE